MASRVLRGASDHAGGGPGFPGDQGGASAGQKAPPDRRAGPQKAPGQDGGKGHREAVPPIQYH